VSSQDSMRHHVLLCVSMCQHMPVRVSMCQHMSLCFSTCTGHENLPCSALHTKDAFREHCLFFTALSL